MKKRNKNTYTQLEKQPTNTLVKESYIGQSSCANDESCIKEAISKRSCKPSIRISSRNCRI